MTAQVEIIERPPVTYQDYSREFKSEAVAKFYANGQNYKQTAQELEITPQTLRYWVESKIEILPKTQTELAQKFENAANFYLDLAYDKAADAPFNHLMTGAGIAIDKMQLLRGQPTSITVDINSHDLAAILQGALSELTGNIIDVTPENQQN